MYVTKAYDRKTLDQSQVLSKHVYIEEQLKMKPGSETRARSLKHENGTKERVLIRMPEETQSYV